MQNPAERSYKYKLLYTEVTEHETLKQQTIFFH